MPEARPLALVLHHEPCMSVRKLSFVAILLAGCSGAGNEDLFAPSPGQSVAATDPTPSNPATPPAAPPDQGSSSSPPPQSGGQDPQKNDPPPPAEPTCTPESEPNDTIKAATPFKTSFCGQLTTKGDVDNAKVTAPDSAKRIKYNVTSNDGRVTLRVFADGFPIILDNGSMPVMPGSVYTFQISQSSSGGHPTYEVDVTFE